MNLITKYKREFWVPLIIPTVLALIVSGGFKMWNHHCVVKYVKATQQLENKYNEMIPDTNPFTNKSFGTIDSGALSEKELTSVAISAGKRYNFFFGLQNYFGMDEYEREWYKYENSREILRQVTGKWFIILTIGVFVSSFLFVKHKQSKWNET